jgi:flagellar basal body rod protein FlgG
MSKGIWSAASGAISQIASLEAAANDIANAGTAGYRATQPVFRQAMVRAQGSGREGRIQTQSVRYARVDGAAMDMTPAEMKSTGRPLDVALRGEGYFVVKTSDGQERYTRVGSLQLTKDGTISTPSGEAFLGKDGRPLKIPAGGDVTVSGDGTLSRKGEAMGQLRVVRFADPGRLERDGTNRYRATQASGAPTAAEVPVESGTLEGSNVTPVRGMLQVLATTRAFEASERALAAFKDADSRAISIMKG